MPALVETFWINMIKLLRVDRSGAVPCPAAENPTLAKLRGLKTIGGASLEGKFPALTLILRDGDESPSGLIDYFQAGLLNVVSSKLKNVFENVGAVVEYFPVTVLCHGKPTASEFFVANPLKRFKSIDLENNEAELDEELDDALTVRKIVIDQSAFTGVKLAVIAEIQCIGVQPEVALAITSAGCIGCEFVDPISVRF